LGGGIKHFLIAILIFSLYKISFSQELVTEGALFVGTFGVGVNEQITYTITSQKTTWEKQSTSYFPITSNSNLISSSLITTGISDTSDPSKWDCWFSHSIPPGENTPEIAFGLYKVTTSKSPYSKSPYVYFYYDTRDNHYGDQNPDVFIKFVFGTPNRLFYSPNASDWTEYSSGDTLNVWEIKNYNNSPLTIYFEPPSPYNLEISFEPGTQHPILTWSSDEFNTGFPIKRKSGDGDWVDRCTSLTNTFIDNEITWPGGNQTQQISYKVRGLNGTILSAAYSNIESILIDPELQKKAVGGSPVVFTLNQNYPNPFGEATHSGNPTTFISYYLPIEGFVTINLYDFLGRKIKTLVNEFKLQGKYQIEFEASNLTSGVYFYKINVGDFYDIKKMIVIR